MVCGVHCGVLCLLYSTLLVCVVKCCEVKEWTMSSVRPSNSGCTRAVEKACR